MAQENVVQDQAQKEEGSARSNRRIYRLLLGFRLFSRSQHPAPSNGGIP